MSGEYVRVCPVCDTENPPERARCQCGASLSGIDFSLKRAPAETTPPVVTPEAPPPAPPETEVAPPAPSAAASVTVCPYPDCAQPNPPGQTRCIYCNRPLAGEALPALDPRMLEPDAAGGTRALPTALRTRYRIVEAFPVSGSEADLLLVEDRASAERRVAKLYRTGIAPDFRLLDILSKTVGDSVVRVLDHGVSDGVPYELLEYVPNGTLAELLEAGPLPLEDVRRMVAEIADALNGIHAHGILHRDLKPDNVLLRLRTPIELALTDFGIASLSEATQRFTSVARTTRYAAPEALTGVIDEKADWWSLGMIALEAATGRHPFEGLTEHVMNHHLATKSIDVRGVYDDGLRMLCRGLLLRDPRRRWGSAEVARWLADDPTLGTPEDDAGASLVRAYRIGSTESTTVGELALALARNWDAARKDLARGQLGNWLEHELHDYNLARKLLDIREHRDSSDDLKLLRFLLAAAPDLPPVWLGKPVSEEAIVAAARSADGGDEASQAWLDSLAEEGVLAHFAAHPGLAALDARWREGWTRFLAIWNAARKAEQDWRKKPRAVASLASTEVVSYDDVMYGAQLRLAPPPQATVNASLLLAGVDDDYVAALRAEVMAALAEVAGYCPWFESLWEAAGDDAIRVLVMHRLVRHARDDAEKEKMRLGASDAARARIIAETQREVCERVRAVLEAGPDDEFFRIDRRTIGELTEALEPMQHTCQRAVALGYETEACIALRVAAEKLSAQGLALQDALADVEAEESVNAIFLRTERIMIPAIFVAALWIRSKWLGASVLVAALLFALYRARTTFRARDDVRSRWRSLRGYANAFLRDHE